MKKMMLALVAFCMAGAVSAVTYSWTAQSWGTKPDYGNASGFQMNVSGMNGDHTGTTGTMALSSVVFAASSPGAWGGIYAFLVDVDGKETIADDTQFKVVAKSTTTASVNGSSLYTKDGFCTVSFDFGNYEIEVDKTYAVIFVNESRWNVSGVGANITLSNAVSKGVAFGDAMDDNNRLLYGNGIVDGSTYVTVELLPEPTTLALLALGVAGLALRRRAA